MIEEAQELTRLPLQFALGFTVGGAVLACWVRPLFRVSDDINEEDEVVETCATSIDLLLALPIFIASMLVVGMITMAVYGEGREIPLVVQMLGVGGFLAPLTIMAFRRQEQFGGGLGLEPTPGHWLGRAVLGWLLILPLLLGLARLSPYLFDWLGAGWEPQSYGEDMLGITGVNAILVALMASLMIPILEEIVFRGFLQPGLSKAVGRTRGILLVAVLFTLNHHAGVWLPIFVLALFLGILRDRSQRLLPCIIVHALHNGVQVLIMLSESHGLL